MIMDMKSIAAIFHDIGYSDIENIKIMQGLATDVWMEVACEENVTFQWISAHMERYTLGGNANESHADRGRKKNMGEKEKDYGGICWLA